MRLLLVGQAAQKSGYARVLRSLAPRLAGEFDVSYFTVNTRTPTVLSGVECVAQARVSDPFGFAQLPEVLSGCAPDVVLACHDATVSAHYARLVRLHRPTARVVLYVALEFDELYQTTAQSLCLADELVCYTRTAARWLTGHLETYFPGTRHPTVSVLPHGLDPGVFGPIGPDGRVSGARTEPTRPPGDRACDARPARQRADPAEREPGHPPQALRPGGPGLRRRRPDRARGPPGPTARRRTARGGPGTGRWRPARRPRPAARRRHPQPVLQRRGHRVQHVHGRRLGTGSAGTRLRRGGAGHAGPPGAARDLGSERGVRPLPELPGGRPRSDHGTRPRSGTGRPARATRPPGPAWAGPRNGWRPPPNSTGMRSPGSGLESCPVPCSPPWSAPGDRCGPGREMRVVISRLLRVRRSVSFRRAGRRCRRL